MRVKFNSTLVLLLDLCPNSISSSKLIFLFLLRLFPVNWNGHLRSRTDSAFITSYSVFNALYNDGYSAEEWFTCCIFETYSISNLKLAETFCEFYSTAVTMFMLNSTSMYKRHRCAIFYATAIAICLLWLSACRKRTHLW